MGFMVLMVEGVCVLQMRVSLIVCCRKEGRDQYQLTVV